MIYRTDIDFKPERIEAVSKKTYDAIIIGGGTSGLISALTLIEQGKKVALFEAGSFSLFTHTTNTELRFQRELTDSIRNSFQYTQKLPDGGNFGPNFSYLGGRGLFWDGASPRFQPHDFNDWPISYDEIIAFYEWAEKGYEGENLKRLNESLALLESVLNGQNFKDTVLNFKSDKTEGGTFHFLRYTKFRHRRIDLKRYSNQEILDKVMEGNETDGTDCYIVYNLTLEKGSGVSTVGYTDKSGNIHSYTTDFLEMTSGEFATHLFHEFTNTIDFEHSPTNRNDSLRDCYSVPYALGNFVEIIMTGSCSYKCKY